MDRDFRSLHHILQRLNKRQHDRQQSPPVGAEHAIAEAVLEAKKLGAQAPYHAAAPAYEADPAADTPAVQKPTWWSGIIDKLKATAVDQPEEVKKIVSGRGGRARKREAETSGRVGKRERK